MMQKTKSDTPEFLTDRLLRKQIFAIPLLPQDEIAKVFQSLDDSLLPHVQKLSQEVPLVRRFFQDIILKIASGNTAGKDYYEKEDHEDPKQDPLKEPESKNLLKPSEIRILKEAFSLVRLGQQPARFARVLKRVRFLRGTYEEVVEILLEVVRGYTELNIKREEAKRIGNVTWYEYESKIQEIHKLLDVESVETILWVEKSTVAAWGRYTQIREKITGPYLRLVYTHAKNHAPKNPYQTINNFQNGCGGLLRAIRRYTASRFAAFSVVADMWIKQSIQLNLKSEVNFIKIPTGVWTQYQQVERAKAELEHQGVENPSYEAIAKLADKTVEKVRKIYETAKLAQVLSLNKPTNKEDEQRTSAQYNIDSIETPETHQEALDLLSDLTLLHKVLGEFDDETKLIFGLVSGCLEAIPERHISKDRILTEMIRQKGAAQGISIILKKNYAKSF